MGKLVRASVLLSSHRGCEPGAHLAELAKLLRGTGPGEVFTDHTKAFEAPSHTEVPSTVLAATGKSRDDCTEFEVPIAEITVDEAVGSIVVSTDDAGLDAGDGTV